MRRNVELGVMAAAGSSSRASIDGLAIDVARGVPHLLEFTLTFSSCAVQGFRRGEGLSAKAGPLDVLTLQLNTIASNVGARGVGELQAKQPIWGVLLEVL